MFFFITNKKTATCVTELIYFLLIIALEKLSVLDSINLLELLINREIPMPNAARIIQIFSKTLLFIRLQLLYLYIVQETCHNNDEFAYI